MRQNIQNTLSESEAEVLVQTMSKLRDAWTEVAMSLHDLSFDMQLLREQLEVKLDKDKHKGIEPKIPSQR